MANKLYYLGSPGDGYGWGVANTNLIQSLARLCDVIPEHTNRTRFDAPVFVPIADAALNPTRRIKRAPKVIGYCFTEWPIHDSAVWNSRLYDVIFAGSTWNVQRLSDKGIKSIPLLQGIDREKFTLQPPSERKGFVVFSGGKWEFRKGQDMVIAAMKRFMGCRGDVTLVTSWHNPWPQSAATMNQSWYIDHAKPFDGLPEDRVIHLPALCNEQMAKVYAMAHIGLFPNRCEAGTNLVMSEFMACGRPVISAYAHGHKDVLNPANPFLLTNGSLDPAGWFNPNVSDMIHYLERAYKEKDSLPAIGLQCASHIEHLTWDRCARQICDHAFSAPPLVQSTAESAALAQ